MAMYNSGLIDNKIREAKQKLPDGKQCCCCEKSFRPDKVRYEND